LFITGIPRCGSSWVGEVLGTCHNTRFIFEPFNSQWVPALRNQIHHFRYLSGQSEAPPLLQHIADGAFRGRQSWKQISRATYRGYLGQACRAATRVVVKDPTASLLVDWIVKRFHAQILIVMRHPCGFASSLDALDWNLGVNSLLRQDALMQDHLERYRDVLNRARSDKWLTRGAIWGAIHSVFARQLEHHPDWRLLKYEDLCANPMGQYKALAQEFGLVLNQQTRQKIVTLSAKDSTDSGSIQRNSGSMPAIWRQRMSPGEIDAVMGIVAEFELGYYTL